MLSCDIGGMRLHHDPAVAARPVQQDHDRLRLKPIGNHGTQGSLITSPNRKLIISILTLDKGRRTVTYAQNKVAAASFAFLICLNFGDKIGGQR